MNLRETMLSAGLIFMLSSCNPSFMTPANNGITLTAAERSIESAIPSIVPEITAGRTAPPSVRYDVTTSSTSREPVLEPTGLPTPIESGAIQQYPAPSLQTGNEPAIVATHIPAGGSADSPLPTASFEEPENRVSPVFMPSPEPLTPAATSLVVPTWPIAAGNVSAASISPAVVGPAAPWIYETTVTIATYDFEAGLLPTELDDPIYPYPRLDFSLVGPPSPRAYKGVVLENGYVSLVILPELGGRIYGWLDKATGRQLLYQNPVIKPTGWGYRGWWLAAGGIEWAFPVEEHGLNEWRPWSYTTGNNDYGLSVTVSNTDDRTGIEVGAMISLDTYHSYVTIHPWAANNTSQPHSYQLWLNAMVTLGGNTVSGQTRIIVPAGRVLIHSTGDGNLPGSGGWMEWPFCGGRDMGLYGNWSGYLGFFAPEVTAGFIGLYDQAADQGIVRIYSPGWPAGTKFFGPAGLAPSIWTDDGSNYVELWSGATGSFWANASLNAGESVGWWEYWYPVNGMGDLDFANRRAALRLTETENGVEIGAAVAGYCVGRLALYVDSYQAADWPVTLIPGQAFRTIWNRPVGMEGDLAITLQDSNGEVLAQTTQSP